MNRSMTTRDASAIGTQQKVFCVEALKLYRNLIPSASFRILAYIGLWTVIAAASAIHWWFYPQGIYPYTWWELFGVKAAVWYAWGLLTPLILWLGARFRIESQLQVQRSAILLAGGLVTTGLYLVTYTLLILWLTSQQPQEGQFESMLAFVISRHSTYYFLAFWAVIAIEHVVAYYHRYLERERLTAQLQAQLAEAQLERLKNQLQPHFLFNALNTVSSMVLSDKKSEAYDTLADLAELLRISLDRDQSEIVSLQEEMEFSRLYVSVMARRFPDQLSVDWQIDPDALDAAVPNMILQPLIENAIKHGVGGDDKKHIVTISAKVDGMLVHFSVVNPVGKITPDALPTGHGIGLTHAVQRLQYHYGANHEFKVDSNSEHFSVSIAIPYTKHQTARSLGDRDQKTIARSRH
ncbi:MAG: histidine kinase [bacterium]|nr:histidine kinase [bacterium]